MPSEKNVLITGCSSGIGLCTALLLKKTGFRVIATARKAEDLAKLTKMKLEAVLLDVNDSNSIEQAIQTVAAKTQQRLFALINNAGYGQFGMVQDLTRDMLRRQFETNVFGLIELTNRVLPWMRKQQEGRIINVSSIVGMISFPFRGAYNASKHAVESLSDTLRIELRDTPIKVCLIEPGPTRTSFHANVVNASSHFQHLFAQKKSTTPEEIQQHSHTVTTPFNVPSEAVAKKILHALTHRHPKRRYYVSFPTHLFAGIKRLFPAAVLDYLLWKIFQKEMSR